MRKILITHCKYELLYNYYVTDDGRIWSEKSQKFMAFQYDKNGYVKVALRSKDLPPKKCHRYSVHRLVLENFCPVPNMENLQVNHKDGDKTNNRLENLEWVTCEENIQHAVVNHLRATVNGSAKLTLKQVEEIRNYIAQGYTNVRLGQMYNVHEETIGRIRRNKSWH